MMTLLSLCRTLFIHASAFIVLLTVTAISCVHADDRFANVQISVTPITDSVYMLQGSGGNIGVSAGTDGVLIIDDQYAPLATKIEAALADINPAPVQYVINTHFHGDHTGGNQYFHEVADATIFAHHNVRVRLLKNEKLTASALPVVTYHDGISIHFNGDEIKVMHMAGHTDGDSVAYFTQSNVLHTGDLFFNGLFPFVDQKSGGQVQAYIDSVKQLIAMIDDQTVIIPGHGGLATRADYLAFVTMMEATYAAVNSKKASGMTLAQVLEQGVAEQYQSYSWRFINSERWLTTLYNDSQ